MHLINTMAAGAREARVRFISHPDKNKSDAMLLTGRAEDGLTVYLLDGGCPTGDALAALMQLRRQILQDGGCADQENDTDYKLEISLIITHFHSDHVGALKEEILPCPYLFVRDVYCPQASCLHAYTRYADTINGDVLDRPGVLEALRTYQPQAQVHALPFGLMLELPLARAAVQIFTSPDDWGTQELADYAAQLYFADKPEELDRKLGIPVINACSLMVRVEYAGQAVLLTGDVMKRRWNAHDESMDRMITRYGEALRADIVKYPHHGVLRNEAWPQVKWLLRAHPDACVVLTGNSGYQEGGEMLNENGIPWVDIRQGDQEFVLSAEGIRRIAYESEKDNG